MAKDTIYNQPLSEVKEFAFDNRVANVFDDMISRSVPLYQQAQLVTVKLVEKFAKPGDTIYDLGCATGQTLALLATAIDCSKMRFVGVDNSEAMLAKCREQIAVFDHFEVELHCNSMESASLDNAGVVILNYTLQFLPPSARPSFVKKIFKSLRPGGALVLSEKVRHHDAAMEQLITDLHHEFKRENKYSDLEISQKRTALENVLIPLEADENVRLLKESGFEHVEVLLKWYSFATFLAVKAS